MSNLVFSRNSYQYDEVFDDETSDNNNFWHPKFRLAFLVRAFCEKKSYKGLFF